MKMRHATAAMSVGLMIVAAGTAQAQVVDAVAKAIHISDTYRIVPNITYLTANNWDAKLDMYQARGAATPNRTLIYVHGGGWTGGSKEGSGLTFLPFLELGWNVVNVEYRLDAYNLFNRQLFGNITANLSDPNFGRPTGLMIQPRFIQMALKLNF